MLYRRVCEFFVRYRKLDEGVRLKIMCPWANYRGIMFFLGFSSSLHLMVCIAQSISIIDRFLAINQYACGHYVNWVHHLQGA